MMTACHSYRRPPLQAAFSWIRTAMDVILHLGAHRTASTTFQAYLRDNSAGLSRHGISVWDPRRTRNGLFAGIWPAPQMFNCGPQRAEGRIALALAAEAGRGARQVIVSDENILGNPRQGVRAAALYPAAGERVARLAAAFRGRITQAVLSIRCPDAYWASLIAMTAARGHPLPGPMRLAALSDGPRGWRDVVADVACALPGVPLAVMPHEEYGAAPERRLARMLGDAALAPATHARRRLNMAPRLPQLRAALAAAGRDTGHLPAGDGHFAPFTPAQAARMREQYSDDLFWLAAGADGLATLMTEKVPGPEGKTPVPGQTERGHAHDQEGRVAQTG
ncbi:hypothetical protein [Lutimaribacter saemankumensis]|uniref:Uncharacterized protein n=1 Tax=Lutimaribacter saemankumensis TaxID=490829 RepID=A0A1G8L5T6_9RHOB|nr:hypothetical protein [Lutimaribacter saemankumensis]SDI51103.1 hypothetical protein SAMN05421850_103192 [Lutimaribacter saemankumensis]